VEVRGAPRELRGMEAKVDRKYLQDLEKDRNC
jgi:hypothetical protein